MSSNVTGTRKISFQTMEMEISLTEVEYHYLKFICEATLRDSDEVLREQIRAIQVAGLPSFDQWRQQQPTAATIHAIRALPPAMTEVKALDHGAVDTDAVVNSTTGAQPRSRQGRRNGNAKAEPATNGSVITPPPTNEPTSGNSTGTKPKSRRKPQESSASPPSQRSQRGGKKSVVDSVADIPAPTIEKATNNGATSPVKEENSKSPRQTIADKPKRSPRGKRASKAASTTENAITALPVAPKASKSGRQSRSQQPAADPLPPAPRGKRGAKVAAAPSSSSPTAETNGSVAKTTAPSAKPKGAVTKSRRKATNTAGETDGAPAAAKKDAPKTATTNIGRRGSRSKKSNPSAS